MAGSTIPTVQRCTHKVVHMTSVWGIMVRSHLWYAPLGVGAAHRVIAGPREGFFPSLFAQTRARFCKSFIFSPDIPGRVGRELPADGAQTG
jgi:hypothetical protein